jgi:hypothetical protein
MSKITTDFKKTSNGMQNSSKRLFFNGLVIMSAILFPWWFTCGLAIVGIFIFTSYFELLFVGIFLDSLYSLPHGTVFQVYFFTIIFGISFLLSFWIKEHLTFSNRTE